MPADGGAPLSPSEQLRTQAERHKLQLLERVRQELGGIKDGEALIRKVEEMATRDVDQAVSGMEVLDKAIDKELKQVAEKIPNKFQRGLALTKVKELFTNLRNKLRELVRDTSAPSVAAREEPAREAVTSPATSEISSEDRSAADRKALKRFRDILSNVDEHQGIDDTPLLEAVNWYQNWIEFTYPSQDVAPNSSEKSGVRSADELLPEGLLERLQEYVVTLRHLLRGAEAEEHDVKISTKVSYDLRQRLIAAEPLLEYISEMQAEHPAERRAKAQKENMVEPSSPPEKAATVSGSVTKEGGVETSVASPTLSEKVQEASSPASVGEAKNRPRTFAEMLAEQEARLRGEGDQLWEKELDRRGPVDEPAVAWKEALKNDPQTRAILERERKAQVDLAAPRKEREKAAFKAVLLSMEAREKESIERLRHVFGDVKTEVDRALQAELDRELAVDLRIKTARRLLAALEGRKGQRLKAGEEQYEETLVNGVPLMRVVEDLSSGDEYESFVEAVSTHSPESILAVAHELGFEDEAALRKVALEPLPRDEGGKSLGAFAADQSRRLRNEGKRIRIGKITERLQVIGSDLDLFTLGQKQLSVDTVQALTQEREDLKTEYAQLLKDLVSQSSSSLPDEALASSPDQVAAPVTVDAAVPSVDPSSSAVGVETPSGGKERETRKEKLVSAFESLASEKHKDRNEDAYLADDERGIYAVLDGVGGSAAGEVASRIGRDYIRDHAHELDGLEGSAAIDKMAEILELAGEAIEAEAAKDRKYRGMAATVSMVKVFERKDGKRRVLIGNAGDSRIYIRQKDGALEQITLDNTPVLEETYKKHGIDFAKSFQAILSDVTSPEEWVALRSATEEELKARGFVQDEIAILKAPDTDLDNDVKDYFRNPYIARNNITRYLSGEHGIGEIELEDGEELFLTSDGIHDNLKRREIELILAGRFAELEDQDLVQGLSGVTDVVKALALGAQLRSRQKGNERAKPDDMTVVHVRSEQEVTATAPTVLDTSVAPTAPDTAPSVPVAAPGPEAISASPTPDATPSPSDVAPAGIDIAASPDTVTPTAPDSSPTPDVPPADPDALKPYQELVIKEADAIRAIAEFANEITMDAASDDAKAVLEALRTLFASLEILKRAASEADEAKRDTLLAERETLLKEPSVQQVLREYVQRLDYVMVLAHGKGEVQDENHTKQIQLLEMLTPYFAEVEADVLALKAKLEKPVVPLPTPDAKEPVLSSGEARLKAIQDGLAGWGKDTGPEAFVLQEDEQIRNMVPWLEAVVLKQKAMEGLDEKKRGMAQAELDNRIRSLQGVARNLPALLGSVKGYAQRTREQMRQLEAAKATDPALQARWEKYQRELAFLEARVGVLQKLTEGVREVTPLSTPSERMKSLVDLDVAKKHLAELRLSRALWGDRVPEKKKKGKRDSSSEAVPSTSTDVDQALDAFLSLYQKLVDREKAARTAKDPATRKDLNAEVARTLQALANERARSFEATVKTLREMIQVANTDMAELQKNADGSEDSRAKMEEQQKKQAAYSARFATLRLLTPALQALNLPAVLPEPVPDAAAAFRAQATEYARRAPSKLELPIQANQDAAVEAARQKAAEAGEAFDEKTFREEWLERETLQSGGDRVDIERNIREVQSVRGRFAQALEDYDPHPATKSAFEPVYQAWADAQRVHQESFQQRRRLAVLDHIEYGCVQALRMCDRLTGQEMTREAWEALPSVARKVLLKVMAREGEDGERSDAKILEGGDADFLGGDRKKWNVESMKARLYERLNQLTKEKVAMESDLQQADEAIRQADAALEQKVGQRSWRDEERRLQDEVDTLGREILERDPAHRGSRAENVHHWNAVVGKELASKLAIAQVKLARARERRQDAETIAGLLKSPLQPGQSETWSRVLDRDINTKLIALMERQKGRAGDEATRDQTVSAASEWVPLGSKVRSSGPSRYDAAPKGKTAGPAPKKSSFFDDTLFGRTLKQIGRDIGLMQ